MINNLLILQAAIAGAMLPLQAALNGTVARVLGHPLNAAALNFLVGLIVLAGLAAAFRAPLPTAGSLPSLPWYYWIGGGIAGSIYVFTALFVAPRIGVTALVAGLLAGQMLASLAFDHFGLFGLQTQSISLGRIAGVVLLVAGVILVRRF